MQMSECRMGIGFQLPVGVFDGLIHGSADPGLLGRTDVRREGGEFLYEKLAPRRPALITGDIAGRQSTQLLDLSIRRPQADAMHRWDEPESDSREGESDRHSPQAPVPVAARTGERHGNEHTAA